MTTATTTTTITTTTRKELIKHRRTSKQKNQELQNIAIKRERYSDAIKEATKEYVEIREAQKRKEDVNGAIKILIMLLINTTQNTKK